MEETLGKRLPSLSPSQIHGLALWVYGTIQSRSSCQSAVANALTHSMKPDAARQALREWLRCGDDKARPTQQEVEVSACFNDLWKWIQDLCPNGWIPLAIDATLLKDRWTALVISFLGGGTAIPIAWHICKANKEGEWLAPIQELLERLDAAPERKVLVMTDRGLFSRTLFHSLVAKGFHPLMRLRNDIVFAPSGEARRSARELVPETNRAWVGEGRAFSDSKKRLDCTLVALWQEGKEEPCLCLSDLPAGEVEPVWYALRMWIENGFRNLKSLGFDWERTRRRHQQRVERHWLVMAVAQLLLVAYGTRVEEAAAQNVPPCQVHCPRLRREGTVKRAVSLVRQGWTHLRRHLTLGKLWKRLWLISGVPKPPDKLKITRFEPNKEPYIPQ